MSNAGRPRQVVPVNPPPQEDRDPNKLNEHVRVDFYSVLGEPSSNKSLRSIDFAWECSEVMYDCCFQCWYKLISLFCGVCMAVYWAWEFVPVVFSAIWICTPFKQLLTITLSWLRGCVYVCAWACVAPVTRSCGFLFIHCGNGDRNAPDMPPLFENKPRRKPKPKPVVEEVKKKVVEEPKAVADEKRVGAFDDYDKEKIAKSVKRQMLMV